LRAARRHQAIGAAGAGAPARHARPSQGRGRAGRGRDGSAAAAAATALGRSATPTARFFGALAVALILFYYAGTSEVAWLYLLAYAIAALIVASFLYARWNRGVRGEIHVASTLSPSGSPRDELPEQVLRSAPTARAIFEGDRVELKLRLVSERGTRGPAQMAGTVGPGRVSTAAGVVPKTGWDDRTVIGPMRRGPVIAAGWKLTTSDLLGLFARRS